ncbi:hypothetical protein [Brevundimonas sp.]|uniref:hypothetical protein n=1 Tax=Brevundimonas sp. TaxID=1871086 RepID=UPI002D30ABD7|nr:hypothetical protein [Brevundimonas sp.]HYC75493.1 hypothetical protein [Brevundimonas sp.]
MAARLLAPFAGASLLALALPAAGQDHSHHPAPPTQHPATPPPAPIPVDPHAGHGMTPTPQPPTASHQGHDASGMDRAAKSPLGPWPMARDASGTSWQPDLSEHGGVHATRGDWSFMGHAQLSLVHDWQNGPRGDDKTFVGGMLMGSARRDFADGSTLNLRAMLSPEPFMGRDGFPLLLAAGETADGVTPLVDRQHPHELVMELSASYARRLTGRDSVFAYIGLPGEPAFGPPAFMHRMSAMDSPEAPITHHWLDSTHIVFGVATLGWVHDGFKLEASSFRGREPDEDRYDIERPELDSWSARASWNPSPEWSLQASYADVTSPEQLEPGEDETRWSASAIHARRFGADGWWSSTLAWGRKTNDHDESKDAWLLETAVSSDDRWTLFARAERIETDELLPGPGGGHGDLYTVSKASVGAVHDWRLAKHLRFGIGALYSLNRVPAALEPAYGGDPDGGMVFVRLKID